MKRVILISFILFACCEKNFSQQPAHFRVTSYTTENGLLSNGIKGLQWDEQAGFLWLATEAGISRFNGLDFANYSHQNTPFIESERILFIVRNNKGKIYSADQSGNLFTIKNNKLLFYQKAKDENTHSFNKRFTISISDTFFNNPSPYKGSWPFTLLFDYNLPDSDTSAYIIYNSRIFVFRMGMTDAIPYDTSLNVSNGFKLNEKCFFINNRDGLISDLNDAASLNKTFPVTNEDGSHFKYLDKAVIYWTNGMGNPILINKNSAWLLSLNRDKITASLICEQIPTDALIEYVQYSPQKKILFLGTDSKGLIVLRRNRVNPMKSNTTDANERNAYYSQVEVEDGVVLTNENQAIGNSKLASKNTLIKGKFTYMTSLTSDSIFWCSQAKPGGGNCLYSYDLKTGKSKAYPNIPGSEFLIKEISNGKRFVTSELGFAWLVGDSLQYIYTHPSINYNTATYSVEETEPGMVLLATCSGILKFNFNKNKLDTVFKSIGYCVRSSWKYKGYIFFGTYGKGFFIWKNGVLKPMPLDKRKYLLYTHCFIPDDEGYCWISTNRGLFKVNIQDLITAYEKNSSTVYYHYYGKNDGMDMIEMNGGCAPCALQLRDKTLSFPTMDGLLWVNPKQANPILPDGEIFIDKITADSVEIDAEQPSGFIVPAKTNNITIRLGFSAWCNKENIYIDYQLNDTLSWRPVNTDGDALIQLSNLSPGDYILRFRKMNGFGINNYSYKTIRFSITKPWHKTGWFSMLVVLAIGGLILLYVNIRTRQLKQNQLRLEKLVSEKTKELQLKNEVLEKNDSIKTRLISIISHDIVTPLKFLTAAGKNLLEKRNAMPEELQKETLLEMTNTSQELQMLSTNILNWIKYQNEHRRLARENFNVHEMIEQVTSILKSLARQKQIVLNNSVDAALTTYQYYEPLKILVYNLLTNAIHFSEKGEIVIGAERENELLKLWVKDSGIGMTPGQIQRITADEIIITAANADKRKGHGLGYLIIKDLLKMTGGSLNIESEKGSGTMITIILPTSQKSNLQENG